MLRSIPKDTVAGINEGLILHRAANKQRCISALKKETVHRHLWIYIYIHVCEEEREEDSR